MRFQFRIAMRFKILIALLFVITAVVGIITFTMARLFQNDKTAYIHDLTSLIALHTAQEAQSLLAGYHEQVQILSRLVFEKNVSDDQKIKMLKNLFEEYQDFVAFSLKQNDRELIALYDAKSLETAGISKDDLTKYQTEHTPPLEQMKPGDASVANTTLSSKLPTLTMTVLLNKPDTNETAVGTAVIHMNTFLRLAGRSKVFETFIIDSQGTILVHVDREQVADKKAVTWIPNIQNLTKKQSMSTTLEYDQDKVPMVGGFAPVEFGKLLVGVQIPRAAAYLTARELLNNLIIVSLLLLIGSAVLGLFWSKSITRPIERLSGATKSIAQGQFTVQVEASSKDEIGDLAQSFNQMATELEKREKALKDAQEALVQSEKMAAFGQLGAGIAHEVKNPLAGILGFAQLSLRKLEENSPLRENLTIIEKETKRCKTIIENLLKFARQEKVAHEPIEVNRVVEDSVAIVEHQLGLHDVQIDKALAPNLPRILGNANQIQQVLMNLLINAQQAMEGKPGLVKATTRRFDHEHVEIRVTDTGPGIPKEIRAKIFEPFFTTKPTGKGTGLGLSVSYGIIKDHKGDIRVESEVGKWTTFIITLPALSDGKAP